MHKDSGWLTILRSIKPGLEVLRDNEWVPIVPRPQSFIVNFGCAMEILMQNAETQIAAVAHRVMEQRSEQKNEQERFSYALFIDSNVDADLFKYNSKGGLVFETGFKEFLDNILRNTYEADSEGLY